MKSRKALTVKDAWELYNMAVLASCKKKDQISERGRWENHIEPILGEIPLEQLTSLDYLKVRRSAENKSLSPQTVYHCLSLL